MGKKTHGSHDESAKLFDTVPREEPDGYVRDFGIGGAQSMSDAELRKRLRDVQPTTGTAPESDEPTVSKGNPARARRRKR